MNTRRRAMGFCLLLGGGLLLHAALGQSQPPSRPLAQQPPAKGAKMEPLAETKLLMEGLAMANFRGLERILTQKPQENQAWTFGRGQALLLAETGNLLMLRPPRNDGEAAWFQRAVEFRSAAMQLAGSMGRKEFERSRANLTSVAGACNRCHQTFRINVQIKPFEEQFKASQP